MKPPEASAPRILVVDDDPVIARLVVRFLKPLGYEVLTAGSSDEAVLQLDERVDAMVLDVRIPGMRGDAFYYLATARQPWLLGRALFVTGDGTKDSEGVARATGCEVMLKPFSFDLLRIQVQKLAPLPSQRVPRVG
ncbi:MAG: response regulator [Gemmatimonadaceae bacterium]|nr:response regulator [Gemmatimonadaceae bacterium]